MRYLIKFWNCALVIIGVLLLQINSCKKDDDNAIKDADGNVYTSVPIGTHVWLVENLKTTKYSNGDLIGTTTPATLNIEPESTPKYQWAYDGQEGKASAYGRLYTWYAATDSRNICPTGWHVPTEAEWTTLTNYLGGEYIAGGKLKETGTTHWESPNAGANNESSFTALPAGTRDINGLFIYVGSYGFWWSSIESNTLVAWGRCMDHDYSYIFLEIGNKKNGFSVRCIKDY